jgi:hypothetical protein
MGRAHRQHDGSYRSLAEKFLELLFADLEQSIVFAPSLTDRYRKARNAYAEESTEERLDELRAAREALEAAER